MGVEIRIQGTAIPCIANEDIQAGLAVQLVAAINAPKVLGGNADPDPNMQGGIYNVVQGAMLPLADDNTAAKYVAAFRVFNEKPPLYQGLPTVDVGGSTVPYALTGFDAGDNLPVDVNLQMTVPRLKWDATIPSGSLMLAYDEGIYTVTSGVFEAGTYNPGDAISVRAAGIWYQGAGGQVAIVFEQNTNLNTLTIKTEH